MKRIIAFVVALSMAMALVSVPAFAEKAATATRAMDPSEMHANFKAHVPGSVAAGEQFSVVVEVDGEYEAHVLKLQLGFDLNKFEYVSSVNGSILNQVTQLGGFSMLTLTTAGDSLNLGIMMPSSPFTGSGELYTATFTAKQALNFSDYGFTLSIAAESDFAYYPNGSTSTPITGHSEAILTDNPAQGFEALFFAEAAEIANPGDDIEVTLNLSGEYQTSGLQVRLYYNADVFEITGFTPGAVANAATAAGGYHFEEYEANRGEVSFIMLVGDALIGDEGAVYTLNMHVADDAEPGVYDFGVELESFIYSQPGTTDIYDITNVSVRGTETEIAATYTVTWVNEDGSVLETDTRVPYGAMPEYNGEAPVKEGNEQYSYTFIGWEPDVVAVTGNATYTAVFEQIANTHTVTWVNEDGSIIEIESEVPYGEMPEYDGEVPTKAGNAQYSYVFVGWNIETSEATGNVICTAVFEEVLNTYTVTWVNWNGSVLETDSEVPYGEMPSYNGATPARPENYQYTYNFIGWDPAVSEVTGNITYTAAFEAARKPLETVFFNVTANPEQLVPGAEFQVAVELFGEYLANGLQIYLNYDAQTFEAVGFENGEILISAINADGLVVTDYTTISGSVRAAYVVDQPINTQGAVFTVTMRVKNTAAVGEYDFTPEVIAFFNDIGDVQNDIEHELVSGVVEIIEIPEHTVTYIVGGEEVEVQTYIEGDSIAPFVCPDALIPEGYHFVEWNGMPGDLIMPGVNIEVTAVFEPNEYAVTYMAGNSVVDVKTVLFGHPVESIDCPAQYIPEGHHFVGWASIPSSMPAQNITLNAVFEINTYTVTWVNWNGSVLETDEEVPYGTMPSYNGEAPVKAGNAQYTYTFTGWTPEVKAVTGSVTYTAVFEEAVNTYTVTWLNWNDSVLETDEEVPYGTMPSYNGEAPVKEGDAQYSYTFIGWEPEVKAVTGSVTYTAVFAESIDTYTVTWVNWNGSVFETDNEVPYGTMPSYNGEAPTKKGNAQYSYTFIGWTPNVEAVTGNATYTAVFEQKVNTYTVTWVNWNGSVIRTDEEVPYGTMPAYNGEAPAKEGDAQYSYTFIGWTPAVKAVTGNATYTAIFEQTVNTYTVTWLNWNGSVLETDTEVAYGTMPAYNGEAPAKEGNAQYSYTFIGWTPNVEAVTGNVTYTAVFEEAVNTYTVTWLNWNGSVLETDEEVPYGTMPAYNGEAPAKEGNAQYSYTFIGWTPAVSEVTGSVTYTAVFEASVNNYTVTFIYGYDLSLTETVEVPYGSAATAPELPVHMWYAFSGWDTDFSNVTEAITVTAQYVERGDVDHDGDVDMVDALLIIRYIMDLAPDADSSAMDIDMNGDINLRDALLLHRRVMNTLSSNIAW